MGAGDIPENQTWLQRGSYDIIPRAVCPELENVIANLELMPGRMNSSKSAKIGDRQRDIAKKLFHAGLLSKEGLAAVLR